MDAMRSRFPEWYLPDEADLQNLVRNATIVIDANVLLDLYRVGTKQRDNILRLLETPVVRERLWIPFQAAFEFHNNRLKVSRAQQKQYDDVLAAVGVLRTSLDKTISEIRDKSVRESLKSLADKHLSETVTHLKEEIIAVRGENIIEHGEVRSNDPIIAALSKVLTEPGQIGEEAGTDTHTSRIAEAKERYTAKIPPGYKDDGPGDYLIWCEILDRAERLDGDILFVSSDVKEDWQRLDGHERVGPRVELLQEFARRAKRDGQLFHHLSLESFLYHSREVLSAQIDDETLESLSALDEDRARRTTIISRLRHPSRAHALNLLAAQLPGGSARRRVRRILAVVGGEPVDLAELVYLEEFVDSDEFSSLVQRVEEGSTEQLRSDLTRGAHKARRAAQRAADGNREFQHHTETGYESGGTQNLSENLQDVLRGVEIATLAARAGIRDAADRSEIRRALQIVDAGELGRDEAQILESALVRYFEQ